jgi:hypothetical protein
VNINLIPSRQADFGMPASGRVRMASLRTLPVTTGVAVSSAAGEKCALVDATLVTGYSRVATDVCRHHGCLPGYLRLESAELDEPSSAGSLQAAEPETRDPRPFCFSRCRSQEPETLTRR